MNMFQAYQRILDGNKDWPVALRYLRIISISAVVFLALLQIGPALFNSGSLGLLLGLFTFIAMAVVAAFSVITVIEVRDTDKGRGVY